MRELLAANANASTYANASANFLRSMVKWDGELCFCPECPAALPRGRRGELYDTLTQLNLSLIIQSLCTP
jgi:hypothetical protein